MWSGSPSARPQPTISMVRAPRVCHPPSSPWLENPLPLPPASKLRARPVDSAAPPWLLAPSSPPWPLSPLAPPGSLVPQAPPWSVVDHPSPRDSTPPAAPRPFGSVRLLLPFGSSSVLCRSGSTAAFWIPISASVAGTICSALAPRILGVALAHRLSVSASASSTTCSAAVCVCVCTCVRERERNRVTSQHISYLNRGLCVCVCERDRERQGHITAECTAHQKSS